MLKSDHPNYGLKSCGYCGKILEPGHTLRSSGTCSETCETKREKRRKDCAWAYRGIDTRNAPDNTNKRRR